MARLRIRRHSLALGSDLNYLKRDGTYGTYGQAAIFATPQALAKFASKNGLRDTDYGVF